MTGRSPAKPSLLSTNIVLRLIVYYGGLAAVGGIVWAISPQSVRDSLGDTFAPILNADTFGGIMSKKSAIEQPGHSIPALAEAISMVSAFLVSLPVAWVYMFTRQAKGYRQTTVHSLVLLPVVAGGVVAMIKYSVPLAFALAGVVAAVRFRNTLDDSRDAVFIFLCTALGIASAVQLDVALVLSVLFNTMVLALWYTDFARTPPHLEGERAQRQLERALALANRTSQFVAQVDRDIITSLAPAQLDALADRLEKARSGGKESKGDDDKERVDARLRIALTDAQAGRVALERALEPHAKRWRLVKIQSENGAQIMEYEVKLRRGVSAATVTESLRRDAAPYVVNAESV